MSDLQPLKERVHALAEAGDRGELTRLLKGQHPADIADMIAHAPLDFQSELFDCVAETLKPEVLVELENLDEEEKIVNALSDQELSDLVEEMNPDDAADVVGDLDAKRGEHVLELMEQEEREDVQRLLAYGEETAGGIMTPDIIAFRGGLTVAEALTHLQALDEDEEPFYYLYIVDDEKRMRGIIGLWDLVQVRDTTKPLEQVLDEDFVSVETSMDQEHVARHMKRYDVTAIPVVDPDGRLVGRITIDDIVDVMEEEASEDMLKLAGTDDTELSDHSAWKACRARLPWLLVTLCTGFVYGPIFKKIELGFTEFLVISMCAPIIMAMSGNTGVQAATLIVRSMAIAMVDERNVKRLIIREALTGLIMGTLCGIAIAIFAYVVTASFGAELTAPAWKVAAVVGFSLLVSMTASILFGVLAPVLFQRFKIDPAVASGPMVTATNDVMSLLIYLTVSTVLLGAA